jgi:aldose sugar dehydrogenase
MEIYTSVRPVKITIPFLIILYTILVFNFIPSYQQSAKTEKIIINDPNLKAELVSDELERPTTMAFLGPNDILVLEKNKGTVQRIIDGKMLPEPVLDVNVANKIERGLLGIAVSKNITNGTNQPTYVFLYYTEAEVEGSDICPVPGEPCTGGPVPLGNRLYRYELIDNKLTNPVLLLDLPATPSPSHDGGVVKIGPDNNVYVVVGNLNFNNIESAFTLAQNAIDGPFPDGRGGILRVTQNGEVVGGIGILGDEDPLNKYYAYGIRNSFGIGFDPVTGNLWETENGARHGDEINLVEPGFNSGHKELMGFASLSKGFDPDRDLVDFGGKGKYSDPEFEWIETIAPTAITFLNSDKLGKQYENDMFVGSAKDTLYHFDLNQDRTALLLDGTLSDKIADSDIENEGITFAKGLGAITDVEVGPDGYLYVVSHFGGAIYRIVPMNNGPSTIDTTEDEEAPEVPEDVVDVAEEEEEEEDVDAGVAEED